jgi:hypothetical protein
MMPWRLRRDASAAKTAAIRLLFARRTKISPGWFWAARWSVGIAAATLCMTNWFALVGDSADGYPGLAGWGPKSASAVPSRYEHIESIPDDPTQWGLDAGRTLRLAERLRVHQEEALLYRRLATLRQDVPLHERIADPEWRGAHQHLKRRCAELGSETFPKRIPRWIAE